MFTELSNELKLSRRQQRQRIQQQQPQSPQQQQPTAGRKKKQAFRVLRVHITWWDSKLTTTTTTTAMMMTEKLFSPAIPSTMSSELLLLLLLLYLCVTTTYFVFITHSQYVRHSTYKINCKTTSNIIKLVVAILVINVVLCHNMVAPLRTFSQLFFRSLLGVRCFCHWCWCCCDCSYRLLLP